MTTGLMIRDVPARLRKKIVADARKSERSIQETAISALAAGLGFEREPEPSRFVEGEATTLLLRLPEDLHRLVRQRATEPGATNGGVALQVLHEHYGLPPYDPGRRRARRAAA